MPLINNQIGLTRALIEMEVKQILTERNKWTAGPNQLFSVHHYQMSLIVIASWTNFQIFVARTPCWLLDLTLASTMVAFPRCLQSKWYSSLALRLRSNWQRNRRRSTLWPIERIWLIKPSGKCSIIRRRACLPKDHNNHNKSSKKSNKMCRISLRIWFRNKSKALNLKVSQKPTKIY